MVRYFIIVYGRVQGVGFRYFVQSTALKKSLTGTVRNMDNGMVEIEAQGLEENITKFITIIKTGNTFIRVDDISLKKIDLVSTEKTFKVSY